MKYLNLMNTFFGHPWAICPHKHATIRSILVSRAMGWTDGPDADAVQSAMSARREAPYQTVGRVAVIPVFGVMAQRVSAMDESSGGISTEAIGRMIDHAAGDKSVGKIVMQIDSPGGSVYGVQELAAKVRAARQEKRVIAVADSEAASAAYWLGSQASEFYVTPGGRVGSIGVIAEHTDMSAKDAKDGIKTTLVTAGRFKGEGHPANPLDEESLMSLQKTVDHYYGAFVADVAKGRGASEAKVRGEFGEGRMLVAGEAKAAGMVDGIASFETVMRRLGAEFSRDSVAARARVVEIS